MTINIPKINSFCCCSLKTASMVAGVLQLIILLLYIIDITIGSIFNMLVNFHKIRYYELAATLLFQHSIYIQTFFALLLIYGAYKGKSTYLMAWLLFGITVVIDNLWSLVENALTFAYWEYFIEDFSVLGFVSTAMLIVYSYYRKIPKDKYIF